MTDIEIPFDELEEEAEKPSGTYRLDLDSGRITGRTGGIEAVNQAIRKALITARFHNLIYDDDYGCEAGDAVHDKNVTPEYLETVLPELVKDALSQDTRITDVRNFEISFENDSAYICFTADTIFGETEIQEVL